MSAKILHGNAVSPGHVIRAGLQNGIMLAWARQKFQALLDWNICRRWIEHRGSSPEHSDILYMVKTDGGVDAAKRLHLPLLPTPSVTVTPPPPGTPFQTPTQVLPTHSDVTICTCTPRFIPRMATDVPYPLTLLSQPASRHDWMKQAKKRHHLPLSPLFSFSDSLSEIKRMMSGCS